MPTLERMFDQLGGLGRLVKGKTVAIKLNLTGAPVYRLGHAPAGLAHWTHPAAIGATVHLLGKAGARRIRLLESPWNTADPVEEYMIDAGWEPRDSLCRPRRGIREYQLSRPRPQVRAHGVGAGLHLPCLRPEPLLPGLRRLREPRQAERARHRGGDALDEELLRHRALHHLRRRLRSGRAEPCAARRPRHFPLRAPAAVEELARRNQSQCAAAGRLPRAAHRHGPGGGEAGTPGDYRRHHHHDGRGRALDSRLRRWYRRAFWWPAPIR